MGGKAKLLIVDDDVQLVKALELYLSSAGYEVISAFDGIEGMRRFHQHRPDLVILDIMLPRINGWEVCERIRTMTNVPMIMLTARGQETDRVKGLKMGADDYGVKPSCLWKLPALLETGLSRSQPGYEVHDDVQ